MRRPSLLFALCLPLPGILALSSAAGAAGTTLYFWGLRGDAEEYVERDGVIQHRVNGQSYMLRRTDVRKIEGSHPSVEEASKSGSTPSMVTPGRRTPTDLPTLLLAAKEDRVQDADSLLIRGTSVNQRGPGDDTALHWAPTWLHIASCQEEWPVMTARPCVTATGPIPP